MKIKFIKNEESFAWLHERLEQCQQIFECSASTCKLTLELLDQIQKTKGPIKSEKLKVQVAKHMASLEWDYDGYFLYTYEEELQETIRLMKEAFGQEEEGFRIPDFAPPVD